ncbi:MAG: Molybdenum cofactor guanylyltransferase (EC 2.7.7.77) [Olavius algarvensis Gamma 1 endosymbiont]|nr:MAG: Molybdenum cofactor guanylyltransferase (EC 2.7.7.77) [Olavius algarvensis Gamma 1 endosymbiont]
MTSLLHFSNLRKTISGRRLLDIPEFHIPAGAGIVLTGRNGAGKSMLLKILAGLEPPDRADVTYQGRTTGWQAAKPLLQRDVIYVHQHPYLFDRSVADNIAYGLRRADTPQAEIYAKVQEALAWAGLGHLATRNARHLSGGEKQRVGLTRARVLSPKLLLLDEPLANLDHESRQQAFLLIRRLQAEGISTLVTSHEPQAGAALGDQHRHLCKTGPCKYTIVRPFLYRQDAQRNLAPARPIDPTEHPMSSTPAKHSDPATANPALPKPDITGVILAGGRSQRMGGEDKGLAPVDGRPMIHHIIRTLRPQVGPLLINANRNLDHYRRFGYPVVPDIMGDFYGPLVGMASALQAAETRYLLTVPCDSPLLPDNLAETLHAALHAQQAEIAVAHDGVRMQPVFALLRRDLLANLLAYLEVGGRKIDTWYAQHRLVIADFSDCADTFFNVNTQQERRVLEQKLGSAGSPSGRDLRRYSVPMQVQFASRP